MISSKGIEKVFSCLHVGPIILVAAFIIFSFFAQSQSALALLSVGGNNPTVPHGLGGWFEKGALPPYGDGDVITFTPCGPMVTIGSDRGAYHGQYIWAASYFQDNATLYNAWSKAYSKHPGFFAHAGHNMIGYSIPNPSLVCSAYPLLRVIGVSEDADPDYNSFGL